MRVPTFNLALVLAAMLVLTAVGAIAWRTASESDGEYDGSTILITVDYVTHCQTMTDECYAAVGQAIDWALAQGRATKACMARRPGRRAIARGALIWLNAHVELHPLPVEEGITRAMDAVWKCEEK